MSDVQCMAEGCERYVFNTAMCSEHGVVVPNKGPYRTAPMGHYPGKDEACRRRGNGMSRYRVTKVLEATVEAQSEGDAINRFIAALDDGIDLGPQVTYPLYRVCPVDIEVL